MQPTHDDMLSTNNEQQQAPGTGQVATKARLIPTALMGPAQQGLEPCPIILPHIAIGLSVAPNIPALSAVAAPPPAAEYQSTLVLTPVTNEGKREETGAHDPVSLIASAARGTAVESSEPSAFPCRTGQWPFPVPPRPCARCCVRRSCGDAGSNGDAGARGKDALDHPDCHGLTDRYA